MGLISLLISYCTLDQQGGWTARNPQGAENTGPNMAEFKNTASVMTNSECTGGQKWAEPNVPCLMLMWRSNLDLRWPRYPVMSVSCLTHDVIMRIRWYRYGAVIWGLNWVHQASAWTLYVIMTEITPSRINPEHTPVHAVTFCRTMQPLIKNKPVTLDDVYLRPRHKLSVLELHFNPSHTTFSSLSLNPL